MKDIDRVNILDVLNLKIASDIMEKFSVEKTNFRRGDIIISPPGTDRVNMITVLELHGEESIDNFIHL